MRLLIQTAFLFISHVSMGQTYSRVVSDSEIVSFINSDLERDGSKATTTIRRKIFTMAKDDYYYKDSTDFKKKNDRYPAFIFGHHEYKGRVYSHFLDTLFSRKDIDFFLTQINGTKNREEWKKPFNNSVLVDNVEQDENHHVENVMFSYSLPLFSADKRRLIIIKGFFCGLLCGGSASYIYEKKADNFWELIKKFNEYGE